MKNPTTFQLIFFDHYEEIVYTLHPRPAEIDNIDRMLKCGDEDYGYAWYECKDCHTVKLSPFHCKSRFCPSCGVKYALQRSFSFNSKMLNCKHRHLVFTIDENLRHFFLEDRSLLDELFHSVNDVISRLFENINKKEHFTPGFVCVLHTFGRDLKWNPHIHTVCTEGGAGENQVWRSVTHFDFSFLRRAFQKVLLERMLKRIGPSFKKTLARSYKDHKDGFYVYAKDSDVPTDQMIKYVGRYLGRPVIANSRIDKYDGDSVTFHYNRHEDDVYVEETIPALDFIRRLIVHIPEKNFKMMRYYGLYAKHHKQESKLFKRNKNLSGPEYKDFFSLWLKWRALILSCFKIDPLRCPKCGKTMSLMLIRFNKGKETMEEHYARIMGKPPGWKPA